MYHAKNHELQRWAYNVVRRARRDGRLVPPRICPHCGETAPSQHSHHVDYAQPLFVYWCCRRCHRRLHATAAMSCWEQTIFERYQGGRTDGGGSAGSGGVRS